MKLRLMMVVCVCTLAACGGAEDTIHKVTPAAADSMARVAIDAAVSGDMEKVESLMHPDVRESVAQGGMDQITSVLDGRTPGKLKLINSTWQWANGVRSQQLLYEAPLREYWLTADVTLISGEGGYIVWGLFLNVSDVPMAVRNGFWHNFGFRQLGWLLVSLLSFGTILFALVTVIRTPMERKWLWMLFSAVGVGQLTMNWTAGAVSIQPFSFQLFGAAFMRSGLYGPWMVSWSLPIGAVWALVKARRKRPDPGPGSVDEASGLSPATPHGA